MSLHNGRMLSAWLAVVSVALSEGLPGQSGTTDLVSVTADGQGPTGLCLYSAVSDDGRFVAFSTEATNILPDDANGPVRDVVLRDLEPPGATILISQSSDGEQGDGDSDNPSVSSDGTYVAFDSVSTNLHELDSNGVSDVFLRDRSTGTTHLISIGDDGAAGNGKSTFPSVSADGSRTAFLSLATNLDPAFGETPAGVEQVWLRTIGAEPRTSLVSRDSAGNAATANCTSAAISGDGRYVAFATLSALTDADTNGLQDVYLRDLTSGALSIVSRNAAGKAASGESRAPAISADGGVIAFDSSARDLEGSGFIEVRRRVYASFLSSGTIRHVSLSTLGDPTEVAAELASISPDGRYVCYSTAASNLVPGDANGKADVFLHDLSTGGTVIASVSSEGASGNGDSRSIWFSLSRDARVLAFRSGASNLVAGTTGTTPRIYARRLPSDLVAPEISCSDDLVVPCAGTGGTVVAYTITATDDVDPSPIVTVDPPSGSSFQPGTHTVNAAATDGSGNASRCSFEVTVTDAAAPEVLCPDDIAVPCTGPEGAAVEFEVAAADDCDPAPAVTASPPSGSVFPQGQTTVTVTATDSSGNSETCSFTVMVSGTAAFLRGDSNGDGRVNVSDAVFTLRYLFAGGDEPSCMDAADADDDGTVSLTDAIFLLNFLAQIIETMPAPGARTPGADPTPDGLGCGASNC